MFRLVGLLVMWSYLPGAVMQCWPQCSCDGQTFSCRVRYMKDLPKFPRNTKELEVVLTNQTRLGWQDLRGLPPMVSLRIVNSSLKQIMSNTFQDFPQLESLDLQNNHLSELHMRLFTNLQNLQTLDISYNAFQTLPRHLNRIMRNVSISLDGNPWHCNCMLKWLTHHGRRPFTCITPARQSSLEAEFRCIAPYITKISPTTHVSDGEPFTISCTAKGDPNPYITWIKPDLREENFPPSKDLLELKNTAVLNVYRTIDADIGVYKCRVYDMDRGFIEKSVEVKLSGEATVTWKNVPMKSTTTKSRETSDLGDGPRDEIKLQRLVIGLCLGCGLAILGILLAVLVYHHMRKTGNGPDHQTELRAPTSTILDFT